jgi:signal transduction histidine kinase/ActR/RegA family two-component response regulator
MDFAAVLLDVSMPDMDGFETAALIRQHPRFESTPIIFVTAVHVTDMDRLRGYQIGAVDYVYIPVIPEILRGKVQVLVDLDRQRQELRRLNNDLARTNQELRDAHSRLQFDNSRQLAALNATLERANEELARSNTALKEEVGRRQSAQARLERASERKDQFLATLAHELRNPLAAIANCVQLLHHNQQIDPRQPWMRDMLGRQVKHLTRLVDDLLDVSRITTGRVHIRRAVVDLRSVVTHAIEGVEAMREAAGHQLSLRLPDAPVLVDGDEVRLIQVVENMLTNSIRYTPGGGRIEVTLEVEHARDAHCACLRVRDSGIGIEPDMLEEVFDLFTQANPTYETTQSGLGIGLALVRGLVQLHGGDVIAESEGTGRGATFTVRLPLATVGASNVTPISASSLAPVGPGAVGPDATHVLIVDDNVDASEGLAVWLGLHGFATQQAHCGDEGLRMALDGRPDVVLLDLGLPQIDGFEVARRIRGDSAHRPVLVAMTGFGSAADRKRAASAGFDHFLVKPVDFDALKMLLEQCAEAASMRVAAS